MIHKVKLSNGQILAIEERDYELSIAMWDDGRVDAYICSIDASGVTVYPNSGDATRWVTEGLKRESDHDPAFPMYLDVDVASDSYDAAVKTLTDTGAMLLHAFAGSRHRFIIAVKDDAVMTELERLRQWKAVWSPATEEQLREAKLT